MFLCIQTYKFVKAEVVDEEEEDANVDLCSKLLALVSHSSNLQPRENKTSNHL